MGKARPVAMRHGKPLASTFARRFVLRMRRPEPGRLGSRAATVPPFGYPVRVRFLATLCRRVQSELQDCCTARPEARRRSTTRRGARRRANAGRIRLGPKGGGARPYRGRTTVSGAFRPQQFNTSRGPTKRVLHAAWFVPPNYFAQKLWSSRTYPRFCLTGKESWTAADWFARNGYQVTQDTIRLERFAIPQQRKRHFLVAVRQGAFLLSDLDDVNTRRMTAGEFLAGLEDEPDTRPEMFYQPPSMTHANRDRVDRLFEHDIHNLPNEFRPACHRDNAHQYISMYGRVHWDRPAQTLTSGFGSMGQGRYVHPTRKRLLTPHEAARLQGIPDFFDFSAAGSRTSLREMIANAVPPQFTATLVERLITRGLV